MKPLVLIILDGFGERAAQEYNAVKLANKPNLVSYFSNYPHTFIDASGKSVGLPAGLMGNSEVGHLTMGAGRIAPLGLTRIYAAIEDKTFFENAVLKKAMSVVSSNHSSLHLMGLVSDGAVHSHQDHLYALLKMAKKMESEGDFRLRGNDRKFKVLIHCFTDGRDTDPKSAFKYIESLEQKIEEIGIGQIATISGRFYAMDRDKRWERTALAYDALVNGEARVVSSPKEAIDIAYQNNETDEFIKPTIIQDPRGIAPTIQENDAVIFFNFRADRARQLTQSLTQNSPVPALASKKGEKPKLSCFACFSEYDASFHLPVAFPKIDIQETFPEIISRKGLKQLRIAETEKYAHVTYFFSGGIEKEFPGEDRALIPSSKEVQTYDLKPEMSAYPITDELLSRLKSKRYDFVICNFANPDMVGHTGNLAAAIQAIEVVDECLGKIVSEVLSQHGTVIITADHGNCEKMADEKGNPHTAHTIELVPFLLIGEKYQGIRLREGGGLPDIAPTLLEILGISKPQLMSGRSLIGE